jgi:hypothetical protein
LNSTTAATRNWQGAGTFSLTDVTVNHQTAIGGTPADISPLSSTDGTGDNTNWYFEPRVLTTLEILTEPADAYRLDNITPAIRVRLIDQFGNLMLTDSSTLVTAVLSSNPGNGSLIGTLTEQASGGIVTFGNLKISLSGEGYRLGFTSGAISAVSNSFTIIRLPTEDPSVIAGQSVLYPGDETFRNQDSSLSQAAFFVLPRVSVIPAGPIPVNHGFMTPFTIPMSTAIVPPVMLPAPEPIPVSLPNTASAMLPAPATVPVFQIAIKPPSPAIVSSYAMQLVPAPFKMAAAALPVVKEMMSAEPVKESKLVARASAKASKTVPVVTLKLKMPHPSEMSYYAAQLIPMPFKMTAAAMSVVKEVMTLEPVDD